MVADNKVVDKFRLADERAKKKYRKDLDTEEGFFIQVGRVADERIRVMKLEREKQKKSKDPVDVDEE